jgi:hypothetical protein
MFRYNKKTVNKEIDELKKLLAITKGVKSPNKSVSHAFLREDFDPSKSSTDTTPLAQTADTDTTPLAQTADTDASTPEKVAKSEAQVNFEDATNNSNVTEMSDSVVKAEKFEGKLKFTYDVKKDKPTVTIPDELKLDDDVITTLQKIIPHFGEWKKNTEKK